jgi:hypothetical protein
MAIASVLASRSEEFTAAAEATSVWVGVREGTMLLSLHPAVAASPAGPGIRPENRRYKAHFSVDWGEPGVSAGPVVEFPARNATLLLPDVPIARFGPNASERVGNAPRPL